MMRGYLSSITLVGAACLLACSPNEPVTNTVTPNTPAANAVTTYTDTNTPVASVEYSESVAEEFRKGCEGSASTPAFCACVFEKVKQKYTFTEFSEIERKILAGEPSSDFVEFTRKASAECGK